MWVCLAVHHSTLLFTFKRYYSCFYQFPFPGLLTVETVTCVRNDMADIMTVMPHADRNTKRCLDVGLNRNQSWNTQTLPGFLLKINEGTCGLCRVSAFGLKATLPRQKEKRVTVCPWLQYSSANLIVFNTTKFWMQIYTGSSRQANKALLSLCNLLIKLMLI